MYKLIIILLFAANILCAQFAWELVGEMERPVAGGSALNNNDMIYVFGGHSDSIQGNVNWVQSINFYENNWNYDSTSFPRKGLVAQPYNNSFYLYGGIFDDTHSFSGIEKWDQTFVDEAVFNFDGNFNRIFSTGHIIGDNFYIIGGNPLEGSSTDTLAYIIEYNIPTDSITFKTDSLFITGNFPEQQMSAVLGNNIYIFGGVINGISQNIYKFNVLDHSFEELEIKLLEPRAGGQAIVAPFSNDIYIIGGFNENSQALNTVEILRAESFIEESSPINHARYNFMATYWDNEIYILGGYDFNGDVINSIEKIGAEITAVIDEDKSTPVANSFVLNQNYPNPFNPSTTIDYSIPFTESTSLYNIELKIYDILGNEINELVNQNQEAGNYSIEFDASDLPSGIYCYQLKASSNTINSFIQTKKMILLK